MVIQPSNCLFCNIDPGRVIVENDLVYAVHDGYPVTPDHSYPDLCRGKADHRDSHRSAKSLQLVFCSLQSPLV